MIRPHHMRMQRDRLLHVVETLEVGGVLSMLQEMPRSLPSYYHTLLHCTPLDKINIHALMVLQAAGLEVLQADAWPEAMLRHFPANGMIMYDLSSDWAFRIGYHVPSVYYSYGNYEELVYADVVVPCSEFAASFRFLRTKVCEEPVVVAPLLDTRALKAVSGNPGRFTVGLISTGNRGKYPYEVAAALLTSLPGTVDLMISEPPDPGRLKVKATANVIWCPSMPTATTAYTAHVDVFVHGTAHGYRDPYGLGAVEAMAMGKALVCEQQGMLGHVLRHREQALLYSTPDEAVKAVLWLRKNNAARAQLGSNGQQWASWQDAGNNAGRLKRILRMIGA